MGGLLGWPVAALWEARPGEEALRFVAGWAAPGTEASTLWEASREPHLSREAGLAGRAWQSGDVEWIPDLRKDENFSRLKATDAIGVQAGFALPIPIGPAAQVVAVSEFFGPRLEAPDEALMALLIGFSDQLAMFINRRRAEGAARAAERTQRHLAAIVSGSQDAVLSKDLDGYILSWNAGAERMYGYSAEEAIGRHISFLVPDDHRNEEMRIIERVARRERIETYETERIRKDGERIDISLTVSPIEERDEVVGASVVARDITLEKRRRNAQAFLAKAGAEMDTSLDPQRTAKAIAATAVPDLATLCVIDFLLPDGSIGGSVAAAADPELAASLETIRRESPLDPAGEHPVARALRDKRRLVIRDLNDPDVAQSDAHRGFIARAGYNSAAVVPMIARGRTLGALSFLHVQNDLRYDREDLDLLQELADRAAMAIDNARLYVEKERIAVALQRDLRPERPPRIPGVELSVVYEPAGEGIDVGGDLYDLTETPSGLLLLLGDVTGKGSEAAATTAQIRHTVRALVHDSWSPDQVMARLRELLTQEQRFASLVVGQMNRGPGDWEVILSTAGHPPALHLSSQGAVTAWGGGTILGPWRDCHWRTDRLMVAERETLLLYTDGWLEAGPPSRHRSSEDLAAELARLPAQPEELTRALREDALRRSGGRLRDDMLLLALRNSPRGEVSGGQAASRQAGAPA